MTIRESPLQCQFSAWTWNPPGREEKRGKCKDENIQIHTTGKKTNVIIFPFPPLVQNKNSPPTSLSCLVIIFGGRTRYLRSGLEPMHIQPATTGTVWCFLCTAPNGAVWDPTESSAQLTSAPTRPPGSSSAGPTPTPHWPCCLQTVQRRHTQREL